MEKTIEQIEKQIKDLGLYLNLEGNGRNVKDTFYHLCQKTHSSYVGDEWQ